MSKRAWGAAGSDECADDLRAGRIGHVRGGPKTGCTTIKMIVAASVGMLGDEALKTRNRPGIHEAWRNREVNWSHLADAQREALLTGESTFRFTSVRNPFERLVSCYLNKIVDHGWGNSLAGE